MKRPFGCTQGSDTHPGHRWPGTESRQWSLLGGAKRTGSGWAAARFEASARRLTFAQSPARLAHASRPPSSSFSQQTVSVRGRGGANQAPQVQVVVRSASLEWLLVQPPCHLSCAISHPPPCSSTLLANPQWASVELEPAALGWRLVPPLRRWARQWSVRSFRRPFPHPLEGRWAAV